MEEQSNKLTTGKKWKRFGITFFILLVIGALAKCGDSVCETDRFTCIERRSACFLLANDAAASCLSECGDLWLRDSNFDTKTCAEPCVNTAKEERERCKKRYAWQGAPVQLDSACETDEAACGRLKGACFRRAMEVRDSCFRDCELLYDVAYVPPSVLGKLTGECKREECWTTHEEMMDWCQEKYRWKGD